MWGPDDKIMEIETPRPEYPSQWPEYPGVTERDLNSERYSADVASRRQDTDGADKQMHRSIDRSIRPNLSSFWRVAGGLAGA